MAQADEFEAFTATPTATTPTVADAVIVNLDRIKEMQPLFNGDQLVILR